MPKSVTLSRLTSPAQEDYLKALHSLAVAASPVSTSALAGELGVSPASVSAMLGKLAARHLVTHDSHRGAALTTAGTAIAVEMVRHHRLLETYLVEALGYTWDEVHEEADRLEHAISEKLEERMWEALGRPAYDPHGDPIPAPDGTVASPALRALHELDAGEVARVNRISDRDPGQLRAIQALGLHLRMELTVLEQAQWEGPIRVSAGATEVLVPLGLARAIYVESASR